MDDDSQDDETDRCPLRNASRDVTRDDVERQLSATNVAADRRGHASSATSPRRPPVDQVNAVGGGSARPVPVSPRDRRAAPMSDAVDCSCPAAAAAAAASSPPDAERRRCGVADGRRPQSSPSGRALASCGRVDSDGGVATTTERRAPAVTRAHTTGGGGDLLRVPDVVYPSRTAPAGPTDEAPLSSSLPGRWPSSPASSSTRHAPRVYYSDSEDRVTTAAGDDETRTIAPSLPYSTCASPAGSPRLRRQPTRETRRLSVTETDEGWTQLNQYKLKDEIGKVSSISRRRIYLLNTHKTHLFQRCFP